MSSSAEYKRQWYKKNPERVKLINKKWRDRNPEKCLQIYEMNKRILHDLKINGCAICGYAKCDGSLEFHHVNSKGRKFNIKIARMANKNLVGELNKCILLCRNCHGEIHWRK